MTASLSEAVIRGGRTGFRWGIYVRISDDREGAGLGVKRQEGDVRAMIARVDPTGTIVDLYVDNDLSAYSGKPRKDYNRMVRDLQSGRINAIGAWHNDRLQRPDLRQLEDFIDLVNATAAHVQTVMAGLFDLSTAAGRMNARLQGVIARGESEHKADRIRRKHEELAAAGKSTGGGFRPYGYRRIYDRPERPHRLIREEVIPEEAEVIREAARRVLAGEKLIAVCRDFNRRGIPTSGGGKWTQRRVREALAADPDGDLARAIRPRLDVGDTLSDVSRDLNRLGVECPVEGTWSTATLSRILTSARIAGQREHRPRSRGETKRVEVGPITAEKAEWPAIIKVEESRRLRELLTDPDRRTSPGPTGRHLCTRVLVCSLCKQTLVGRSRGKDKRMYMCDNQPGRPGCGRTYIDGDGTDQEVTAMAAQALSSSAYRQALARRDDQPNDVEVLDEISACERQLEQFAEDLGEGLMTRAEWLAARKPVERRLNAAKQLLRAVDSDRVLEDVPSERKELQRWLLDTNIEVSRRRAVILLVLNGVVVKPAVSGRARFDPDRLVPDWRM
ncbi:hypothetical protein GCM10023196_037700 [Actinoallomurus vinaceus]|uniref:Recombinase family protein n=1 Tax=Actinoallomurus vinaceus TaxID=1080074 RepID=A0ABP8UC55_9ACTN